MSIGTMEVHIMFIMAGHKNFKNEALVTLEGFYGQKKQSFKRESKKAKIPNIGRCDCIWNFVQ